MQTATEGTEFELPEFPHGETGAQLFLAGHTVFTREHALRGRCQLDRITLNAQTVSAPLRYLSSVTAVLCIPHHAVQTQEGGEGLGGRRGTLCE